MNLRLNIAVASLVLLTGCGVLNPKVEFGQKKVPDFPTHTERQQEALRDAAWAAATLSERTVRTAIAADRPAEEIRPLEDTALLAGSVSVALGPPLSVPILTNDAPAKIAEKAVEKTADFNKDLRKFEEKIWKIEGKEVEGTGVIQTTQWTMLLGIGAALLLFSFIWKVLNTVMNVANPAVGAGMTVVGSGVKLGMGQLQKGFVQLLRGGENFKQTVTKAVGEQKLDEKTAALVLELFRQEHQKAQDETVQVAVQDLTRK